jgi:MYXO-CTERM domain-containing protein
MYVFGGYQYMVRANTTNYDPASRGGRLFYFDPDEVGAYKTVREFNFVSGFGITPDEDGDLLSISQGDDGELYAMFVNGDVKRIVGPLAGDFDGDFDVDAVDLTDPVKGWIARFGVDLDGHDFLAWQQSLGTANSAAEWTAAPEPASHWLAAAAAAALAAARRRRPRD